MRALNIPRPPAANDKHATGHALRWSSGGHSRVGRVKWEWEMEKGARDLGHKKISAFLSVFFELFFFFFFFLAAACGRREENFWGEPSQVVSLILPGGGLSTGYRM